MSGNQDRKPAEPYTRDIELLLREIEDEPVPERLLELAGELQAALAERRSRQKPAAEDAAQREAAAED